MGRAQRGPPLCTHTPASRGQPGSWGQNGPSGTISMQGQELGGP